MAENTMELIPLERIERQEKDGEVEVHEPGPKAEPFRVSKKEGERLLALKAARLATDEDAEETEKRKPTREELEARAKELGIDLTQLTGTGKKGALKNDDIAKAIAGKEAAAGAGGNPSIVE